MAISPCKYCDKEPASVLLTDLSDGSTAYVGLWCLPAVVSALWEDSDVPLPTLTFGVDVDVDQTAADGSDVDQAAELVQTDADGETGSDGGGDGQPGEVVPSGDVEVESEVTV